MKLLGIRPLLRTPALDETIAFYGQLGFHCVAYSKEWGWAALRRDAVELMVALPLASAPGMAPAFTGSFYFSVDQDIDKLWAAFREQAEVCYPLETFSYGMREFAIYDNNGYLLQFGQEKADVK